MDHAHHQAADRLTNESFISPELQRDILACFGKNGVTINIITGAAEEIPPVDTMLAIINRRLQNNSYRNPIMYAEKELIKNGLHAMLEATEVAIFVTSLEAAYRNQQYIFYQNVDAQLTANLTMQKTNIQEMINQINELEISDQPQSTTSLFSWFGTPPVETSHHHLAQPVRFQSHAETVTIHADLIDAIVKKNNYKQEPDADIAANLLFKQCFIAQQHHLKDALWIDKVALHVQSPITPDNYIFTDYPSIQQMCEIAQNLALNSPIRADLLSPMTQEQATAHKLLLHIRQAIQTAMYIANAKSNYNIGYILPTFVVRQLGGIVSQLLIYDAQLSELCKNPMYGATEDDSYSDKNRSAITNVAAGVITLAAIAGTLYVATPAAILASVAKAGSMVYSLTGDALWYANGVGIDAIKTASKVSDTFEKVGQASKIIAGVGAGVTLVAGGIQAADKQGYIPLDQIDPNAKAVVDAVYQYGARTTAVAGTAAAIGALGSSLKESNRTLDKITKEDNKLFYGKNAKGEDEWISGRLYNAGKIVWDAKNLATQAASVGTTAVGGALYLANQLSSTSDPQNNPQAQQSQQQYSQPSQQYNQASQQQSPQVATQQFPPQAVAMAFTNMIQDAPAQGFDAVTNIRDTSVRLIQENKISPPALLQVLRNVQQNSSADPNITNGLGEIIQSLAGHINSSAQPQ